MAFEKNTADLIRQAKQAAADTGTQPHPAGQRSRVLQREGEESAEAHRNTIRPPSNERQAAAAHEQAFGRVSYIRFGKVHWASPYTNWYRVELDGGDSDISCCALRETSVLPFSVRSTNPIGIGAHVLVWYDVNTPYGVILGAVPPITTDGGSQWHDWVSQGSNGGFRRERYHKEFPQLFVRNGGQVDFSNGSPPDTSSGGDWARMDDLGGGIHIDALMKFFRVDESCGLWLFYMDRLARLACNNLDVISSVHEQVVRWDEGEAHNYTGTSPFPWEAHGAWKPGVDTHREEDSAGVHYSLPYGKYEPKTDDQQAIYRSERYDDYLGQGFRRSVFIPPPGADGLNRWPDASVRPGVFAEQIGLEGHYGLQAAHSIFIRKRLLIPIPKKLAPPEDPKGDDFREGGYRFASAYGDGPDHAIAGRPLEQDDLPNVQAATQLQDATAYAYNWKGLHPFAYHVKDFKTPQESQIAPFSTLQYLPPFSELAGAQWLGLPPSHKAKVDHRYGEVEYFQTEAGLAILPDGSVVIRDGYGSEIRMTGGSIQASAAGDIWLQPGRNLNIWAGDDAIVKAQNSIDLSATKHDIRLKAERHCDVLAGNGGQIGRILLDCQTAAPAYDVVGKKGEDVDESGVLLKCAKGDIVSWGFNIKLRTGGGDVLPGMIVLDAAKGAQVVRMVANQVVCHVANGLNVAMSVAYKTKVHHFGPNVIHAVTGCCMEGGLLVRKDGIQLRGYLVGIECIIVSDLNKSGLIAVHKKGDLSWDTVEENLAKCKADFNLMNSYMQKDYDEAIVKYWYADKRPGNDTVITNTQFAPRTLKQMGTEDFRLPETYHQTLANAGAAMPTWVERVIKYQGEEFMPHPSKDKWKDDPEAFRRADFTMHKPAEGLDEDRPGGLDDSQNPYLDPKLAKWQKTTFDGVYPVAKN